MKKREERRNILSEVPSGNLKQIKLIYTMLSLVREIERLTKIHYLKRERERREREREERERERKRERERERERESTVPEIRVVDVLIFSKELVIKLHVSPLKRRL